MAATTRYHISYDPAAAFLSEFGIAEGDLAGIAANLERARREVLEDARDWEKGATVPKEKVPLDAGFHELPNRLLTAYEADPERSEVGRILATAHRLAESVDRIVVLGIGGSYMGARALFEACCHPFHNELPRSDRGGRPRFYFEGNNVDNDAIHGLLDLLASRGTAGPDSDWGIVVISKSGGTLETAVAFRVFLRALLESTPGKSTSAADLIVPVTGASGKLFNLAKKLGCREMFHIPDGVGGRFSIFCAVGLLPAAILGLDIVALLRGARDMNERFAKEPVAENTVLRYVGVCRLLEELRGLNIRVLSTWGKGVEAVGLWYDQLLAESLGKEERGATPLTVVNTRDLHSRGQQHQEGKRDKLITNVIVEHFRRDPIRVGESANNEDDLNSLAGKTVPEILRAAIDGTNAAYKEVNRPTADIRLPRLNEYCLGQLFQMLMLATVVEGRLIGINPYGQPGVEAYKRHMTANLRG